MNITSLRAGTLAQRVVKVELKIAGQPLSDRGLESVVIHGLPAIHVKAARRAEIPTLRPCAGLSVECLRKRPVQGKISAVRADVADLGHECRCDLSLHADHGLNRVRVRQVRVEHPKETRGPAGVLQEGGAQVFCIHGPLEVFIKGLRAAPINAERHLRMCSALPDRRRQVRAEENADAAAHYRVACRVHGPGKTGSGPEVDPVRLVRSVRRPDRAKIRLLQCESACPIHVHNLHG